MRIAVQMTEAATDTVIRYSNSGMAGGAAISLVGWFSATEWAAIGGFLVAAIGLLVSLHFNRRRDRREQAEHDARMKRWEDGKTSDAAPLGKK